MFLVALALSGPAAGAMVLHSSMADASVGYSSPYTFEQTLGTAIRLLRVDLDCKITEKDLEAGYLRFEYTSSESGKKPHKGTFEIIRGKTGANVVVQLPTLPRYHEQMIIDALAKKLLLDNGEPPKNKPNPVPVPDEDGGVEAGPTQ